MRQPFYKRIKSWKFCKELLFYHYPYYEELVKDEQPLITNYNDFNKNWILVEMFNDDLNFIKRYFRDWYNVFIMSDDGKRLVRKGILEEYIYDYFRREYQCIELQDGWDFYLLVNRDWIGY